MKTTIFMHCAMKLFEHTYQYQSDIINHWSIDSLINSTDRPTCYDSAQDLRLHGASRVHMVLFKNSFVSSRQNHACFRTPSLLHIIASFQASGNDPFIARLSSLISSHLPSLVSHLISHISSMKPRSSRTSCGSTGRSLLNNTL